MFNNSMMQFNPYQQNQNNSLTRVNGLEGAKSYPVPVINSTVALFDSNEDVFYVKTTDGAGFPTIRMFRFEEVTEDAPSISSSEYIKKKDLEDFEKEIKAYVEQLIHQKSTAKQQNGSNGSGKNNN